jgi:hypothetical protein
MRALMQDRQRVFDELAAPDDFMLRSPRGSLTAPVLPPPREPLPAVVSDLLVDASGVDERLYAGGAAGGDGGRLLRRSSLSRTASGGLGSGVANGSSYGNLAASGPGPAALRRASFTKSASTASISPVPAASASTGSAAGSVAAPQASSMPVTTSPTRPPAVEAQTPQSPTLSPSSPASRRPSPLLPVGTAAAPAASPKRSEGSSPSPKSPLVKQASQSLLLQRSPSLVSSRSSYVADKDVRAIASGVAASPRVALDASGSGSGTAVQPGSARAPPAPAAAAGAGGGPPSEKVAPPPPSRRPPSAPPNPSPPA